MKTKDILEWVVGESINGEFLNFVNVPEEGENEWEQNEEWWNNMFGACPPHSIPAGRYLYYYDSSYPYAIHYEGKSCFNPDVQIEIPVDDGFDYIYLYKVEE